MGSPAGLDYTGDFTTEGEQTKTDSTELELSVVAARAATNFAAAFRAHRKFRCAVKLCELTSTGHGLSTFSVSILELLKSFRGLLRRAGKAYPSV
jgi:hypothetical protein